MLMAMPEGLLHYINGYLILGLKLWLLPRVYSLHYLPGLHLYLVFSCITSLIFLTGTHSAEPTWSALVALAAAVAALECSLLTIGLSSLREQKEVQKWCGCVGALLCVAVWFADPRPYPHYPVLSYMVRLYTGAFTVGWLVALLGYSFTLIYGVRVWLWHAGVLLARVAAFTAVLLVHDRGLQWRSDDVAGVVNTLTLVAWLWVLPKYEPRSRTKPTAPTPHLNQTSSTPS